ncbi:MAG: hypothetical protein AMXMBFR81_24710 [Chthonomonas sp.]
MSTCVYIDGFNTYGAIGDLRQNHLKWISYRRLSRMVDPGTTPQVIKLFSAIPQGNPDRQRRHDKFLEASRSEGVEVILGHFKKKTIQCKSGCPWSNREFVAWEEKETDVNLAIHLVRDVIVGCIERVVIFSTDSDIAPAVEMAVTARPSLEVLAVNIGQRHPCWEVLGIGERLGANVRKASVSLAMLERCLLPQAIELADGGTIVRPTQYDPP